MGVDGNAIILDSPGTRGIDKKGQFPKDSE